MDTFQRWFDGTDALTMAALALAVWSLYRQHNANNEQADLQIRHSKLQERLTQIEEDRRADELRRALEVDFACEITRTPKANHTLEDMLVVTRLGSGKTYGVAVSVRNSREITNNAQPKILNPSVFPIPEWGAGEVHRFQLSLMGLTFLDVDIEWADGPGELHGTSKTAMVRQLSR